MVGLSLVLPGYLFSILYSRQQLGGMLGFVAQFGRILPRTGGSAGNIMLNTVGPVQHCSLAAGRLHSFYSPRILLISFASQLSGSGAPLARADIVLATFQLHHSASLP